MAHLRQLAVVVWPVTSVACQEPTQRVRSPTVSTPDEEEDKRRMDEETMCVGVGETYTHAYAHTHAHTCANLVNAALQLVHLLVPLITGPLSVCCTQSQFLHPEVRAGRQSASSPNRCLEHTDTHTHRGAPSHTHVHTYVHTHAIHRV